MKKIIIAAMIISSVVYGGGTKRFKKTTFQSPYLQGTGDSLQEAKSVVRSLIVPTIAAFALTAVQNYYNQVNNK